MPGGIPVSVLVMTLNEGARLAACLAALSPFEEIIVVDSGSRDETCALARAAGVGCENFTWDGAYPKKRQWCLDHASLRHDWVFFVDADEIVTPDLAREIAALFAAVPACDGYFVRGRYIRYGRVLRHGLMNNKLALFDRRRIEFPIIDDLDLPGMGEIEGHYQPRGKTADVRLGQLDAPLLHDAYTDPAHWLARHRRYAAWEAGMNARGAWPRDPDARRQFLKTLFRRLPCRGFIAFLHSYILKRGFLDGTAGFCFARDRWRYYRLIGASPAAGGEAARWRSHQ